MDQTIKLLKDKGALDIKDGSVEVFFDDLGIVQEIIFRRKKVRRDPKFEVLQGEHVKKGKAQAFFDPNGVLQKVIYETFWKREK